MDILEWETYKDFRIIPYLLRFDESDPETRGRWIVAEIDIQPKNGGSSVKTLKLKNVFAPTKQEAFRLAVDCGKKEVDQLA